MIKEYLIEIFSKNQGKIIGAVLGLFISILILSIGFLSTLLILGFVFGGYFIGKMIDNKVDLTEFLDRILPSGWK